jgi:hypothetical protein
MCAWMWVNPHKSGGGEVGKWVGGLVDGWSGGWVVWWMGGLVGGWFGRWVVWWMGG